MPQASYASEWDAIADTPEEAANLSVRAELTEKIAALIGESGWTQAGAAVHCGVTQPRISDLLRGRVSRFSPDALVASKLRWGSACMSSWRLLEPVPRQERVV